MSSYLDFDQAVDEQTTSWQRADPDAAMIEQRTSTTFAVLLPDGDESHTVTYGKERGAHVGYCDCDGDRYHDLPCAHLCTLRKAEFIGASDVHGQKIEADDMGPGTEPEPELIADGGDRRQPRDGESRDGDGGIRPVPPHVDPTPAGADGRTFGTPESQL